MLITPTSEVAARQNFQTTVSDHENCHGCDTVFNQNVRGTYMKKQYLIVIFHLRPLQLEALLLLRLRPEDDGTDDQKVLLLLSPARLVSVYQFSKHVFVNGANVIGILVGKNDKDK